jgi:hypothetical protein
LTQQRLFDENGEEVVLRTVHNYTMAEFEKRCNGHGTYNEQTKQCVCNSVEHRTGSTCSECETGYVETAGKCARPEGCTDTSCGCGPASVESHCVPLGVCSPSTDAAHPEAITCSCPAPRYTGNNCEKCAVGYSNYPHCTEEKCKPACVHGTCNENATCTCQENFAGADCSECKAGFSGSNCDTEHGIVKVVGFIFGGLLVVGLIAFAVWYFKFKSVGGGDAN